MFHSLQKQLQIKRRVSTETLSAQKKSTNQLPCFKYTESNMSSLKKADK